MANDYFQFQQFIIRQDRCAMKVGTDGTLLGAWAALPAPFNNKGKLTSRESYDDAVTEPFSLPVRTVRTASPNGSDWEFKPFGLPERSEMTPRNILDIGTGTGLIALMMAQRFPEAHVTGIDIDPQAVRQARENVAASPFADRVTIIEGDITQLPSFSLPLFSAIVCNPPYFDASLESPDAQRTLARHTTSLSYRQLMASAWQLLSDDGELSVVIPFDCKARLETEAILTGFHLVRSCAVRTTERKPPRRFLMAFRKHPGTLQTGELVIGSEACNELTKDFYLKK